MIRYRRFIQSATHIILDFDGTLVDSNEIKWKAFEACFCEYPQELPEIMAYCRQHNHTPRFEKFPHIVEAILKKSYTPELERQLLDRYDAETTAKIIAAPEIPGALRFLEAMSSRKIMVLLSSTPHEVLIRILKARKMDHFFSGVQGAPVNKAEWIQRYMSQYPAEKMVFMGDSAEDAASAKSAGVAFIAIGHVLPDALSDFSTLV